MGVVLVGRFLGAGILDAIEANAARTAIGLDETGATLTISYDAEGKAIVTDPVQGPIFIPVNSSAIRGIGYRPVDTIVVEFVRGGTYSYDGPLELFMAFASAPSKGQFFNAHFRGSSK